MNRAQQASPANDPFMLIMGVLGLIGLLLVVAWFKFHTELSMAAMFGAWHSIPLLEGAHSALRSIGIPEMITNIFIPTSFVQDIPTLKYSIPRQMASKVTFSEFSSFAVIPVYVLRPLFVLAAPAIAYHIYQRSKAARLKNSYNIFSLSKVAMLEFPQIRPAIIADLFSTDPDKGEYRREESPMRYAIKHELLRAFSVDFKGNLQAPMVIPTFDAKKAAKSKKYELIKDHYETGISTLHRRCVLNKSKTRNLFVGHLGEPWKGSEHLNPLIRGLYAAIIAFVSEEKDECFALFEQFNRSWTPANKKNNYQAYIDLKGVDEVIAKYEKNELVAKIVSSHAFVNTVIPALLQAARTKGRITTPLFLWVKVVDRTLWYSLSQEGGQCAWSEACAARSHKIAEQSARGRIYKPFVDEAVIEFEDYLMNTEGWIPLDKEIPEELKELDEFKKLGDF